jgi:hypothetical protein
LVFDEVVNHLFVASRRCSANPGLQHFANFVAFEAAVADIGVATKIIGWLAR